MDRHILNASRIEQALRSPSGGSSDYRPQPGDFRAPPDRPLRPASVLVPLVERGTGLKLILTRRAALLRSTIPGQVAFPGGKQEPRTRRRSPPRCARREEEIGLAAAASRSLGRSTARDGDRLRRHAVRRADRRRASGRGPTGPRSTRSSRCRSPSCSIRRTSSVAGPGAGRGRSAQLLRDPLRAALHLGRDGADAAARSPTGCATP